MECLEDSDVKLLSEYLNAVIIPQWKTVTKEKPKRKRNNVSIDLLNELE